jgi:hypothetical protein
MSGQSDPFNCPRCVGTGLDGRCAGCGGSGFFGDYLSLRQPSRDASSGSRGIKVYSKEESARVAAAIESRPKRSLRRTHRKAESASNARGIRKPTVQEHLGAQVPLPPVPLNKQKARLKDSRRDEFERRQGERAAREERLESEHPQSLAKAREAFGEALAMYVGPIRARQVELSATVAVHSPFSLVRQTLKLILTGRDRRRIVRWITPGSATIYFVDRTEHWRLSPFRDLELRGVERTAPNQRVAALEPAPKRRFDTRSSSKKGASMVHHRVGARGSDDRNDERRRDGSYGGHFWRETGTGQFGSHPSHDSYDDDSNP